MTTRNYFFIIIIAAEAVEINADIFCVFIAAAVALFVLKSNAVVVVYLSF